ncbi:hypothetical protein BST61_g434 [Cercospora zeina]
MVAARTRQLSHRLKGRRAAILERRAEGGSGTPAKATAPQTTTAPPSSSGSGFVAVNSIPANGKPVVVESVEPPLGSNAAIRTELLRHFESLPHNQNAPKLHARHQSTTVDPQQTPKTMDFGGIAFNDGVASNTSSLSPVPTNAIGESLPPYASETNRASGNTYTHRPSLSTGNPFSSSHTPLKHNFSRPLPPALESSQPFRPLCQAHMDSLPRGTRVMPPCDRCRRLRMDCVKNLTSCAGCTRKHARCHWRDVSREELGALDHLMDSSYAGLTGSPTNGAHPSNGYANGTSDNGDSDDDDSNPLEDLEALGEKEEQENQIREDEEGLRNAKELARQGFEDSMRDGQQPQHGPNEAGESGVPNSGYAYTASVEVSQTVEDPRAAGDLATPPNSAQVQERPVDLPIQTHGNPQREMLWNREPPPVDPAPSMDTAASNGGFRAVNESMNHGSTIASGGTGWRAI